MDVPKDKINFESASTVQNQHCYPMIQSVCLQCVLVAMPDYTYLHFMSGWSMHLFSAYSWQIQINTYICQITGR